MSFWGGEIRATRNLRLSKPNSEQVRTCEVGAKMTKPALKLLSLLKHGIIFHELHFSSVGDGVDILEQRGCEMKFIFQFPCQFKATPKCETERGPKFGTADMHNQFLGGLHYEVDNLCSEKMNTQTANSSLRELRWQLQKWPERERETLAMPPCIYERVLRWGAR